MSDPCFHFVDLVERHSKNRAMTIRVLHIITSFSPDGAQRMLLRIVASMDKERFTSGVVSLEKGGTLLPQFEALGIPVYSLGMKQGIPALGSLSTLRKIVSDFKPDLIQGWLFHANLAASLAALFASSRAPVVWNIRRSEPYLSTDRLLSRAVIKIGALFSKTPASIIHCAQASIAAFAKAGYATSRATLIFNGFDISRFEPSSSAHAKLCQLLGIPIESLIVGTIGRFHIQKDFPNFIRAAAIVAPQVASAHFVMIGRDVDASNSILTNLIAESRLEGRVHLVGERHDVPQLLPGFDLYGLSSLSEGFPNVVGEAMACAVPCVVTDVGASRDMVGAHGIVVPPADPTALANGMIEILRMEPERRRAIGLGLRKSVIERFALETIVKQYEEHYTRLLSA